MFYIFPSLNVLPTSFLISTWYYFIFVYIHLEIFYFCLSQFGSIFNLLMPTWMYFIFTYINLAVLSFFAYVHLAVFDFDLSIFDCFLNHLHSRNKNNIHNKYACISFLLQNIRKKSFTKHNWEDDPLWSQQFNTRAYSNHPIKE